MSTSSTQRRRTLPWLFVFSFLAASGGQAEEPAADLSGTVSLTSDYVFRGVSQTMSNAALQVGVDLALPGGLSVYGWASNVDFTSSRDPDDGADVEVDLGIGIEREIGAGLVVEAGLVRYLYPDVAPGVDYDYTEWLLAGTLSERLRVQIAYSDDVFNSGEPGWAWQVHWAQPLSRHASLSFAYGEYELDQAYGTGYAYGEVSLARDLGRFTVALAYHDTSAPAAEVFAGAAVGERWVASVELSLE